jgi:hypothetical protein
MRTTLDIDDDILAYARERAEAERRTMGQIISAMVRDALLKTPGVEVWNGIPQLPVHDRPTVVTLDLINELRDDEE